MPIEPVAIAFAVRKYLEIVRLAKQKNTVDTYSKAMRSFCLMLEKNGLDPEVSPVGELTEEALADFAIYLKDLSPATERLYIQSAKGFYKFLAAERLAEVNLPRLDLLLEQRVRRPGIRIPQFPDEEIERLLASVSDPANLSDNLEDDENAKLRAMRDRAFLLTLADTGLRVHEACKLRRGDMNWNEGYAVIIGKGDKQAVVRFTSRSLRAIKDYLSLRAPLDGNSGKRLASLPVFARHDKGSGGKVKPMTPTTGRNIVKERVTQLLGKELADQITPHTFRHYFVTAVLRGTGNLRYAQELARHKNIQVTERYTHLANEELDKAYYDVFERESE